MLRLLVRRKNARLAASTARLLSTASPAIDSNVVAPAALRPSFFRFASPALPALFLLSGLALPMLAQVPPPVTTPQIPGVPKPRPTTPTANKDLDKIVEEEEKKLENPLEIPKELRDLQEATKADDPLSLNPNLTEEEREEAELDERLRRDPDFNSGSNYDGPDFLRRSRQRVGRRERGYSPITWAGSIAGTYDSLFSGFQAASNAAQGDPNAFVLGSSYGVQAGFSASGQKRLRRTVLGLDYAGNYAKFTNRAQFDGASQFINFGVDHKLNKRWDVSLISNAGTTNRVYSSQVLNRYNVADIGSVPIQELFDSRISFANQQALISLVVTPRILVSFQGEGGVIRRKTRSLADLNLYSGGASLMYRINRGTSIGVDYQFQTFNYGRQFGETDINMIRVGGARRFNAFWQGQFALIGFRQQTIGVEIVSLSPELQALLGRVQSLKVFDSDSYNYGMLGQVDRTGRSSIFSVRGERTIRPGNGLFNTSLIESLGATLSSKSQRRIRVAAGVNWDNFKPIGSTLGNFQSIGANLEFSKTLKQRFSWIARLETRRIRVASSDVSRRGSQVMLGISYGSDPSAPPPGGSPQGGLGGGGIR